MATIEIKVMGPLQLFRGGAPVLLPATRKSQSLLAYLAINLGERFERNQLAGMFWSDRPEHRSRRSLATALWRLRRTLGPGCTIESDRISISMPSQPGVWVDVAAFEELLRSQGEEDLRRAVELYRGDLLAGLYDDWVINARYRVQASYEVALTRWIDLDQANENPEGVLQATTKLLELDPLREDAHQAAIWAYIALGLRAQAVEQYRRCQAVLSSELGLTPSEETYEIIADLLEESSPKLFGETDHGLAVEAHPGIPATSHVLSGLPDSDYELPLVGRTAEISLLQGLIGRLHDGEGCLIVIRGEAGVGKSRLLNYMLSLAEWKGITAAMGACYAVERAGPYLPISDILQTLSKLSQLQGSETAGAAERGARFAIAADLQPQPSTDGLLIPHEVIDPQPQVFKRVAAFLRELAGTTALVLAIDDFHWATRSTTNLLRYLLFELKEDPIAFVVTERIDPRSSDQSVTSVADLTSSDPTILELGQLDIAEVEHLIEQVFPAAVGTPQFAERLFQESGGNPLYVAEFLKSIDQLIPESDPTADRLDLGQISTSPWPIPSGITNAVRLQARGLPPDAVTALQAASVAGIEFDLALLCDVLAWDEDRILEAIEPLLSRRLLHEGRGMAMRDLAFTHPMIRETFYEDLPRSEQQRLHRLWARALERSHQGSIDGEIAHHWNMAAEWKLAAEPWLHAGFSAAKQYAYPEALEYWRRAQLALRRLPDDPDEALATQLCNMLLARADIYHLRGDTDSRWVDLDMAQAWASRLENPTLIDRVAVQRAHHLNMDGDYEQALELAKRVAERTADPDRRLKARALAEWGFAHYFRGEHLAAMTILEQALTIETEPSAIRATILSTLSYVHYHVDDYLKSLAYRQEAMQIRRELAIVPRLAEDLTDMGVLYLRLGDTKSAERYLAEALASSVQAHSKVAESYARNQLGELAAAKGDMEGALDQFHRSVLLQRETGSRRGEASALSNAGAVQVALGEFQTAEVQLEQAAAIQASIGYAKGLAETQCRLANLRRLTGRPGLALEACRSALSLAEACGDHHSACLAHVVEARVYANQGELDRAEAAGGLAIEEAERTGTAPLRALALVVSAQVLLAGGSNRLAVDRVRQAQVIGDGLQSTEITEEEIEYTLGQSLMASDQSEEAEAHLNRARRLLADRAGRIQSYARRKRFLTVHPVRQRLSASD